jgi:DNA sulfur modification protein DndC
LEIFGTQEKMNHLVRETIDRLREMYLENTRLWILPTSMGKDSTLQLDLVWRMLTELPPKQRTKPVYVITSSTRVEIPVFEQHVRSYTDQIRDAAKEQGLPIEVHVVEPEMDQRFFAQVLGFGNPPPTEASRFRYCSDKLKATPVTDDVDNLMASRFEFDEFDALMLIAVRSQESRKRKSSIEKHSIGDGFARHAWHPRILVFHPIVEWETDFVWDYLLNRLKVGWGADTANLLSLYNASNGGECELTAASGRQSTSCGGSRFGCWTCCFVGREDKMLINLINAGDENVLPLYLWKRALYNIRNDVRFRLPLRKRIHSKIDATLDYVELSFVDGAEMDTAWWYEPGPISIVARKMLLESLLQAERDSGYIEQGYRLIEEEEILFILSCWAEEGINISRSDIRPKKMDYNDFLSLKPNGSLNVKENTYKGSWSERELDITAADIAAFHDKFNRSV